MSRTTIDLDDDLLSRAAEELGTRTKRDTVHAALRAALRVNATRALMDRMAANGDGTADEELVNGMWNQEDTEPARQ